MTPSPLGARKGRKRGRDSFSEKTRVPFFWSLALFVATVSASAAERAPWGTYSRQPDAWYRGSEGLRIAANIRSQQSRLGDWPKNVDNSAEPYRGEVAAIKGTFDNGATVGELRFLARAFRVTDDARNRDAFLKGLDHIIAAQYPTGGWPQSSPPGKGYHRHITFNDNTMVNLMLLVRDVADDNDFEFVGPERRAAARKSFEAGIACILKCQVTVNGALTVWCAQHDEITLEPRPARTFEPVSLSGAESADILMLLMSLNHPGSDVVRAIEAGVAWFSKVKLTGIRETKVDGDKKIVHDPSAPPLWARFYEIPSMRPIFSGRDSVIKYDIAQIEPERRNGYAWYGGWGSKVAAGYKKWARTHGVPAPSDKKRQWGGPKGDAKLF
jgi:PelA/Pel-15E family pectate lyase